MFCIGAAITLKVHKQNSLRKGYGEQKVKNTTKKSVSVFLHQLHETRYSSDHAVDAEERERGERRGERWGKANRANIYIYI